MNETNTIKLKTESISKIPFHTYDQDFTFIVNGSKFKTSRLISDLLSPKISKIHLSDPTFDTFPINTKNNGDFSHIYNLLNFKKNEFSIDEYPFISEVIESLGNENIEFCEEPNDNLTIENVLNRLKQHEKFSKFYRKTYQKEVNFLSKNFSQIVESSEEEFRELSIDTILSILSSENLQLKDEDQLLNFVNHMYSIDSKYALFYEKVHFVNVSKKAMINFIGVYDFGDISGEVWKRLTERLIEKVDKSENFDDEKETTFSIEEKKLFSGIVNFLASKNEVDITSSSYFMNDDRYHPKNVVLNDNNNKCFLSENNTNSWICFDFKNHSVKPSDYIIRSPRNEITNHYLKNWVVEGSDDKIQWEIIDKQENCDYLNGSGFVHSFKIENENLKSFRYIRLRQNGPNVFFSDYLAIQNIEIYGKLS